LKDSGTQQEQKREHQPILFHIGRLAWFSVEITDIHALTLYRLCLNASRLAFLPSSRGTWFRLENYGRAFRSSHLGQFPTLHRMNIVRHRRGDLCIRDDLASTIRRDR
jgi:hypothetical protein